MKISSFGIILHNFHIFGKESVSTDLNSDILYFSYEMKKQKVLTFVVWCFLTSSWKIKSNTLRPMAISAVPLNK